LMLPPSLSPAFSLACPPAPHHPPSFPTTLFRSGRRTHLCARLRGSLRLIPVKDIHYLQAEEKYVVVHHERGEDLIEESLKSLERSEEHTSELQSRENLVCRLLLEKKKREEESST